MKLQVLRQVASYVHLCQILAIFPDDLGLNSFGFLIFFGKFPSLHL